MVGSNDLTFTTAELEKMQIWFTTAELEKMLFNETDNTYRLEKFNSYLPDGNYRVIDGELFRIIPGPAPLDKLR